MPCFSPINVPRKGFIDLRVDVPCGQCIGCRLDRSRDWAARCVHEASLHDLSVFVTLTYDDDFIPVGGTLVKRHFQLFMKRLRKAHSSPIRFFACGEYGDETLRPHYHAILFGVDFADKRKHSQNAKGDIIYVSDILDSLWSYGHCWIGNVSFESAAYVARYCVKKVNGDKAAAHYGDREPEFALMSLKPGIGAGWYDRFRSDVYPSDQVVIRGRVNSPPRFYDERLKKEDEFAYKLMKERRISEARKRSKDQTPARLAVRREVQESKLKMLKRTI